MARKLPNVYTTLNDLSALIEGDESLTVGITLRANRGPINEALNITDSSDFLTRYTFTGKPGAKQDSTYFDIIELLKISSSIYVSRAANNPTYGGLVIKKEVKVGDLVGVTENNNARILLNGNVSDSVLANTYIRIDTGDASYRYYVSEVKHVTPMTQVLLTEEVASALIEALETAQEEARAEAIEKARAEAIEKATAEGLNEDAIAEAGETAASTITFDVYYCAEPVPYNEILLTDEVLTALDEVNEDEGYAGAFVVEGNVVSYFNTHDIIRVEGATTASGVTGAEEDTQYYTVVSAEYDQTTARTTIYVEEAIDGTYAKAEDGVYAGVSIYCDSISNPDAYVFRDGDLCLITGIDPGAYNSKIGIAIESGNEVELDEGENKFKLYVHNMSTDEDLEEYLVSFDPESKSVDGSNVFITDVVEAQSQYIKVITPDIEDIDVDAMPASTPNRDSDYYVALGGGSDGGEISVSDNINALEVFADKTVPVSILVNGNNENVLYQSAMIAICEDRLDCFAFLRTIRSHEKITTPTSRVTQMINYKKNTLKSTSYLATMYGPHVTVYDNYNGRYVVVGADSISCKQWLKVIAEQGFPYAAAGPLNGTVNNVTVDWKIGDESGEAEDFNEASMNMLVYDARSKYYYFNTQNTLQLANSAFRNVGAVLNVLNIKENLTVKLKDYIQLPISDSLQEAVQRTIETYMDGCKSAGRVTDYVVNNNTTKLDISNNELHFMLTLAPAYYAQKIYLVVNVVNATYDFEILQSV